jgi:hypothetical protein
MGNLIFAAPAKVGNFGEFWGIDPSYKLRNAVVGFPIMAASPSILNQMLRRASLPRRLKTPQAEGAIF